MSAFHHRAINAVLEYVRDGNDKHFVAIEELIDAERKEPSILPLCLNIQMTTAEIESTINTTNALILSHENYHVASMGDSDVHMHKERWQGFLIRALATDQEEGSCFLFHCTRTVGDELILSPVIN